MREFILASFVFGFAWLAYYSMQPPPAHHYYANLKQRQAAMLKELYHITDSDLEKPINLFAEP